MTAVLLSAAIRVGTCQDRFTACSRSACVHTVAASSSPRCKLAILGKAFALRLEAAPNYDMLMQFGSKLGGCSQALPAQANRDHPNYAASPAP